MLFNFPSHRNAEENLFTPLLTFSYEVMDPRVIYNSLALSALSGQVHNSDPNTTVLT